MSEHQPFDLDTVFHVAARQSSCDLGAREVAILNVESGTYYGLETVGARIWQLVQKPCRVAEVRDVILSEYKVTQERCDSDLRTFLGELEQTGLIERVTTDAR